MLADDARRIKAEWATATEHWRDDTARSFHERFWSELEREADMIAGEAAALEEALARARRVLTL
ncbi:MAG: hypothetical protein IT299_04415 [Dehalococcoidia bacterium]|nr:hypothetical protein [Dehalococcoidia bacterium]